MKQRRVWLVVLVPIVLIGLVLVRQRIETQGDRSRITLRLQELKSTFASDPTDSRALAEITGVLSGNWSFARTKACTVLRELGPPASAAIPDLITALNCGDGFVEREAARALGSVARNDPRPVPALVEKLQYFERDSGWFAAEALGDIGKPATSAIPEL
jgi:HEAT repeat protein